MMKSVYRSVEKILYILYVYVYLDRFYGKFYSICFKICKYK